MIAFFFTDHSRVDNDHYHNWLYDNTVGDRQIHDRSADRQEEETQSEGRYGSYTGQTILNVNSTGIPPGVFQPHLEKDQYDICKSAVELTKRERRAPNKCWYHNATVSVLMRVERTQICTQLETPLNARNRFACSHSATTVISAILLAITGAHALIVA